MARDVAVNLRVGGVADVQKALQSVSQAVARAEKTQAQTSKQSTSQQTAADRSWIQRRKETAKLAEQVAKQQARAEEGAATQAAKAAEKAERDKTRAVQQAARQREQIVRRSSEMAGRVAAKQASDEIAARKRVAAALSSSVRTGVSKAVGMAGTVLALGGGFSIADAVSKQVSAQGLAADIANSGYMPNGANVANRKRRSSSEILSVAQGAAMTYGLNANDALEGLQGFVGKTGDLDQGMKILPRLAELSRATGASLSDVANAAAEVFNSDTNQSADDLMATMRAIAGEGKLGAVEIRDLASQMSKVTAAASKFEGDKAKNILTLGAMAQEAKARGGATDAAEATTAVARFSDDVAKKSKDFSRLGIDVKGKNGTLRDPEAIVEAAIKETNGDVVKLTNLFGDRSAKAVLGYAQQYREAGGGDAGMAKLKQAFDEARKATMSETEVKESAAKRMEEVDAKAAAAMAELERAVGVELVPELTKMIPIIRELLPIISKSAHALGQFIEFFAQHPFEGMGFIVAASIAKELAAAGIGEAFKAAMTKAMAGSGGGGGGAGGLAGPLAIAGAVAIGAEKSSIDAALSGQTGGQRRVGELRSMMKSGDAGQIATAQKEIADAKARVAAETQVTWRNYLPGYGYARTLAGVGGAEADYIYRGITGEKQGLTASLPGMGGEDVETKVKKFTAALEISKEAGSLKSDLQSASSAASDFADAMKKAAKVTPGNGEKPPVGVTNPG